MRSRELPRSTVKPGIEDLAGCILFGAGVLARQILGQMHSHGIVPSWIVDSNPDRHGELLMGVSIAGLESLGQAGERLVIVASTYLQEMADAVVAARVRNWAWCWDIEAVFGRLAVPAAVPEIVDERQIDRLAELLATDRSREVLKRALVFRATGCIADLPEAMPDQYFPGDLLSPTLLARLVDCGAYTGDTLMDWWPRLGPGSRQTMEYHGIEPDPDNFKALRETCAGLPVEMQGRIHLHPVAVGRAPGTIRMAQGNSGTALTPAASDGPEVDVVRLDDLLAGQTLTALKMDLEGFEPEALEGARGIILEQRPLLLIAVYHRPEHLWQIPLWINDLGLGYQFQLRHHSQSFAETVCYAIPEQR